MALMDEFKTERESIKDAPLKKKLAYFWEYYKWHLFVVVVVIWLLCSLIHHYVTYKEVGFRAVLINCAEIYPDNEPALEFAELAGIDTEEYEVLFDSSMVLHDDHYDDAVIATTQKMMVYYSAGDLDVMVCDYKNAARYIYNDCFGDIRALLTKEQIAKLEPYFIYADASLLAEIEAIRESGDLVQEIEYPPTADKESLENPVPVGISLEQCDTFLDTFYYKDAPVNLFIFRNSAHLEQCMSFIEYACKEILE